MRINGSTNKDGWTYKLEVSEIATSVQNRTSTLRVQTYIGRASSRSYLGGNYSNSVSVTGASTQTKTGNIPYPTYIDGGGWLLLQTYEFTVPNTDNPTTVTISSSLSSSDFSPSSASASDNMQLTVLHLNPVIISATLLEKQQKLINWNIPNNTIVNLLSNKQCTLDVTLSDNATVSKVGFYRTLYNKTIVFETPEFTISDNSITFNMPAFRSWYYLPVIIENNQTYTEIKFQVEDNMGGIITKNIRFPFIPYNFSTIERTSTNIFRSSPLIGNKALLNFKGTIYKNNTDNVGINNSYTIKYKIWEKNTAEPTTLIDITSSSSITADGTITINDYELSNLDYTKQYNWYIQISDVPYNEIYGVNVFTSWGGTLTSGIAVWSEYEEHVDFLKLTVNDYNPFEYSEDEIVCGEFLGEPLYRKVFTGTGNDVFFIPIDDSIKQVVKMQGMIKSEYDQWWNIPNHNVADSGYSTTIRFDIQLNRIAVIVGSHFNANSDYIIIFEYTKNTN